MIEGVYAKRYRNDVQLDCGLCAQLLLLQRFDLASRKNVSMRDRMCMSSRVMMQSEPTSVMEKICRLYLRFEILVSSGCSP